MPIDPVRLSKTMAFLLRHKPEVGGLTPDDDGYVELEALVGAVSKLLRTSVETTVVVQLVTGARVTRFEIHETRIRAVSKSRERKQRRTQPRRGVPDILYHATTDKQVRRYVNDKLVAASGRRNIYLSASEAQAWQVAHRHRGKPRVLYIDTGRARRHGVKFFKNRRSGLYAATPVPTSDVLNLQKGFDVQLSAGGIPIQPGPDGKPRLALIRVARRSGVTWEVAKGKLEPGESPELAAVREVKEEMGLPMDLELSVTDFVSEVRYGFLAPGGLPRLKSIFLYLLKPTVPIEVAFEPSKREGIGAVRWFTPTDAAAAVTHTSLKPALQRVVEMLEAREKAAPPPPEPDSESQTEE